MEKYKNPNEYGYDNNKDILFKRISSIHITKFRSLRDRRLILGSNITVITGKNGTLKSSLLGLIAHPFSSPNNDKDIFENSLKTTMGDVFRLSIEKDIERYQYEIEAITDKEEYITETIKVYPRPKENRHRVTVGTANRKGDGNFFLNTAYINLKRLFPMVDTLAKVDKKVVVTEEEKHKITNAYLMVMTRDAFKEFDCISDRKTKNTLGPREALYDYNSISSGEDNLGNILLKMLSFERHKKNNNCLQGILCIDEIEASLHPVASTNFFDYIFDWSKKNNIQVVFTTHSLYLIKYILSVQEKSPVCKEQISLNIISTAHVGSDLNYLIIHNPNYSDAYKELTLNSFFEPPYQVNILCEDTIAASFIKAILGRRALGRSVNVIADVAGLSQTGTSCTGLISLGKNGGSLLGDSIIILDPDVKENDIKKVKENGVDIFILPDAFKNNDEVGWPIERTICKYIFNTPGDSQVFSKEEKAHYVNILHGYNIFESEIETTNKIAIYKNWQKNNSKDYNMFLKEYIKENEIFRKFKNKILDVVNAKRVNKGFSEINE